MKYKNWISPPARGKLDGDARGTPNIRGTTLIYPTNRPIGMVWGKLPVMQDITDLSACKSFPWIGYTLASTMGKERLKITDLYNRRLKCKQQAINIKQQT